MGSLVFDRQGKSARYRGKGVINASYSVARGTVSSLIGRDLVPPAIKSFAMGTWIKDTMTTGATATAVTTAAVAILGRMENGNAAGAINAISHMLWGEEAATTDRVDARHTLTGAGLNAAAATAWAGMHELLLPRRVRPTAMRALVAGAATSVIAYMVDYHVVPKRFTPGFEKKLSQNSLFGVYAVLALSLAAGSLARGRRGEWLEL